MISRSSPQELTGVETIRAHPRSIEEVPPEGGRGTDYPRGGCNHTLQAGRERDQPPASSAETDRLAGGRALEARDRGKMHLRKSF